MKLTRQEVEHVARLARVGLDDEEVERLQAQLSNILENFEVLKEVDTEGVPPTAQSIPMSNVLAADEPLPSYPPQEVLANAPEQEEGFFRVRAVLE